MDRAESNYTTILFLVTTGVLLALACKPTHDKSSDEMPPLYSQPITVPINLDSGYHINPFTGDSIHPLINSLGDTIVTGRFYPMKGKETDAGLYSTLTSSPGPDDGFTVSNNVRHIPSILTSTEVDESKFKKSGRDSTRTKTFVYNSKGDTILTGVSLPISGKPVTCRQPQLVNALAPASRDQSNFGIRYLGPSAG